MAGCRKCPAFTACPLKGILGDYRKPDETPANQRAQDAPRDAGRNG
jgi:hypothetical protein